MRLVSIVLIYPPTAVLRRDSYHWRMKKFFLGYRSNDSAGQCKVRKIFAPYAGAGDGDVVNNLVEEFGGEVDEG